MGVDDASARRALSARGYVVPDIQALAVNQSPFARPVPRVWRCLAPGVHLDARTMELGNGHFTNSYTMTVAANGAYTLECRSDPAGFHLRDMLCDPGVVGAINGSFTFISDDPGYQPTEPHFDLCVRDGRVASLPSSTKPALMVGTTTSARTVRAEGRLRIGSGVVAWIGSKVPAARPGAGRVVAYGAANCVIQYRDSEVTGFTRVVAAATNVTPRVDSAADVVVAARPSGELVVAAIVPGGGTDLFTGSYILQATRQDAAHWRPGDRVAPLTVDGVDIAGLTSATSLGPSVADATTSHLIANAYDDSLGVSPFRGVRYPRSVIYATTDGAIHLRVFDGAPLTTRFQGLTPAEVAAVLDAEGHDLRWAYHLDGGQSSKLAYRVGDDAEVAGSMHYLVWPRGAETAFRWNGVNGRVLTSCVLVREVS